MEMFRGPFPMVYILHSLFVLLECVLMWMTSKKRNLSLTAKLLKQGISESIFYGDLVYKCKIIAGKPNSSDQFKTIIKRYKKFGYNLDIMWKSACLDRKPNHGPGRRGYSHFYFICRLEPSINRSPQKYQEFQAF